MTKIATGKQNKSSIFTCTFFDFYGIMKNQENCLADQRLHGGQSIPDINEVTSFGKTYTIANVIQQLNKQTLVIAYNKTLVVQLCGGFKDFFQ